MELRFCGSIVEGSHLFVMLAAFAFKGHFWRGNLHRRSTARDGGLGPGAACSRYRETGRHFTRVTNHFQKCFGYLPRRKPRFSLRHASRRRHSGVPSQQEFARERAQPHACPSVSACLRRRREPGRGGRWHGPVHMVDAAMALGMVDAQRETIVVWHLVLSGGKGSTTNTRVQT